MNSGDVNVKAWDLLLEDSPNWITINAWKKKQTNNNFGNAKYVISLAQYYPYGPEYFVFGGLYQIKKKEPEVFDKEGYELTLLDDYKEYRKRLIIKIKKPIGRDVYNRLYSKVQSQLEPEVYEISPNVKLGHFPGYQNVSLTHRELQQ